MSNPSKQETFAQRLRLAQWSPWPLLAIALLVIGVGLGLDLRRQFHESATHERERLAAAATLVAQGSAQRLAVAAQLLARLASALDSNPGEAQAIVNAVSGLESGVVAVLAIDADGRVIASSRVPDNGADLSREPWVGAARADAESEPQLFTASPAPPLQFDGRIAARARRGAQGEFVGVVAALLASDFFSPALIAMHGEGAAIQLIDADGQPVLTWPNSPVADSSGAALLTAETAVMHTHLDRPWSVQVTRTQAAVFAAWGRQAKFGLLLWLLVAIVAVLAGVIATLRRNEMKRLRGVHQRLLQGVDEGLAGIDEQARVRFANAAFARYLDTTPGDLLGRDLRELLRWPSRDVAAPDPISAVISAALPRFEGACELSGRQARATITPTREGDEISWRALALAEPSDAEEARSPADRLYRTLFDLSPDGVLIIDLDSEKPLAFNPAAARLLGYGSEEFGRLRVREHEANAAAMDSVRNIARVLAEGRVEFETRYRTHNNSVRDVQVLAQTIEFGGRPALYWIVRDITERKRAATELRESAALAERANRARSEFLANMSHEIRTPMTAILGLTYLLQKTELTPIQRDQSQKIDSAARTLLAILDDLLDYSKLEAGRILIEQRPFALREVLDEIALIFAPAAREKGLSFELSVAPNTPMELLGDPARLRQVLLNLVGNAVKFTEQGMVTVQASGTLIERQADLRFTVRDTGIGIDTAQLSRAFEPFYQVDASSKRRFGGTGLGLPITQWLINLMGGALSVVSTPGSGSEFQVRLQLAVAPGPPDAAPLIVRGPDASARLHGLSVLLVEDHPINRHVAREILAGEGALVEVSCDGPEAIARLTANPAAFDVVLMDIQMPQMDGYEATQSIRNTLGLASLPIIAMTANASPEDRAQSRRAGMNDHLAKPIDVQTLVATILRHARPGASVTPVEPAPSRKSSSPTDEPPVLALEQALARLSGHRTLYAQMARMFAQEQGDSVRHLREALRQGDRLEAARTAHTLKGVAATLGAEALSAISSQLERALKRQSDEHEVQAISDRLVEALDQAILALRGAAEQLAPAENSAVPLAEFERAAFERVLEALVLALVDSNMAALDHYTELRELATFTLLGPLLAVDEALRRLDFPTALDACSRVEVALEALDKTSAETHG